MESTRDQKMFAVLGSPCTPTHYDNHKSRPDKEEVGVKSE
jgi:hypothetical protein